MSHNSSLVQSGVGFYVVGEDGSSVELTVPSTVTVSEDRKPRFDVNGVHAVVVNSVDAPLIVDDSGIMLFLSPEAPAAAPTLGSSVGAGALTGTYQVKYTYAIRNLDGVIVAESGFSPSASVTVAAKKIAVSAVSLLTGLTSADYESRYEVVRRFYRTTNGTSTYFLWYTIEDNTSTLFEDDTSDAGINTLAAQALATVPFLSVVASFRDRLFGVDDSENRESLRYSEAGLRWAWPEDNFFIAAQVKGDSQSGITSLMARRDALGIAKSNMLIQLTGTSDNDFRMVTLSTSIGCISHESAAIYRDQWYFLGQDGVYRWNEDGITCISDGKVRSWFTTDDYFDRSEFPNAFATFDGIRKVYKLFLVGIDEEVVDKWVEYDVESGTWWGPHLTSAYEFTSAFQLASHNPLIGEGTSDGYITVDTPTRSDNADHSIPIDAATAPIRATDPPVTTYFGQLNLEIAAQAAGQLSVYPTVGEPEAEESAVMERSLRTASESMPRLGYGRFVSLRFVHNVIDQLVQILGFEIDPVNAVGRRQ